MLPGFRTVGTIFTQRGWACLRVSNRLQLGRAEVHIQAFYAQNTLNVNQTQHNQIHLNTHDLAITQLVEQVAEARHRESLANTEGMVNMMVGEMNCKVEAEELCASQRMSQMMALAERREGQFREELSQQSVKYKRVLDKNAKHSNATKDLHMNAFRTTTKNRMKQVGFNCRKWKSPSNNKVNK